MKTGTGFFVLVLIVGLAGCGGEKKPRDPDLAAIEAYAKAEVTIERLRIQKGPNWDAISAQYEITSTIVKKIDSKRRTDYDPQIREALRKCAAGENVKVNQQTLAKGLQHVTVLAITAELDATAKADSAGRKIAADRIAAYFEGIRPTFVRRDQNFFPQTNTLEKAVDAALERLAKADSAAIITARRQLEDVLARTYALCVLYEVLEIEKLRDSDLAECDTKRAEAVIFYRIIQSRIRKRSPRTDEVISNMLKGSYDVMDAKLIEASLKTGLAGVTLR